jgi:hypothetical protein
MDEIKVKVAEAHFCQTGLARCLNAMVVIVPDLIRDPQIVSRNQTLECPPDFDLVSINFRAVDVPIPNLD